MCKTISNYIQAITITQPKLFTIYRRYFSHIIAIVRIFRFQPDETFHSISNYVYDIRTIFLPIICMEMDAL